MGYVLHGSVRQDEAGAVPACMSLQPSQVLPCALCYPFCWSALEGLCPLSHHQTLARLLKAGAHRRHPHHLNQLEAGANHRPGKSSSMHDVFGV